MANISHLVKPITLRTCVGLYDQIRPQWPHLFRKSPPNGSELTIDYVDTANNRPNKVFNKTILAIHGVPGNLSHFSQLIQHFDGTGTRVIVPNMPDFRHSRENGFWHTTPEKVTFVKDFLKMLKVDRIDCLVAHSFGIQTIGALWEKVCHLVILPNSTHRMQHKSLQGSKPHSYCKIPFSDSTTGHSHNTECSITSCDACVGCVLSSSDSTLIHILI